MSEYRPKLFTTERDGKVAIWIKMPGGESFNVWDLDKKVVTQQVMKAIASAFERGYLAHVETSRRVQDWIQVEIEEGKK